MTCSIHSTAVIDDGASVGEGSRIWHWTHVCSGAVIGSDCTLGQNVFVAPRVVIGNRCKIQNNVSVYEGVKLEDEVFCGPSVVFTNVRVPRATISRMDEHEETLVGRGATIGANSTIVCGARVGKWSFVGASSLVTKDVPDYALVFGQPARQQGWVCKCGYQLVDYVCRCGRRFERAGEGLAEIQPE